MALAVLREEADLDALRRAAEQAKPVSLAGERSLPVLGALESLLPAGDSAPSKAGDIAR